jgi:hypothetical protein
MSASLIGRLGSSAFRLSTTTGIGTLLKLLANRGDDVRTPKEVIRSAEVRLVVAIMTAIIAIGVE